jgi:hypothetical protein
MTITSEQHARLDAAAKKALITLLRETSGIDPLYVVFCLQCDLMATLLQNFGDEDAVDSFVDEAKETAKEQMEKPGNCEAFVISETRNKLH